MSATQGVMPGPIAAGMYADESGEGEAFLHTLWRRRSLVIGCLILGILLATSAILILPARYSARAVMRVDTDDIDTSSVQSTLSSTRELELRRDHQIETQLQLLGSRPLMRRVVRDLALYDDPEFNPGGDVYRKRPGGPGGKAQQPIIPALVIENVTDRLLDAVRVSQDGQTTFLNIDVSSMSANKAARIANKIATTFVQTEIAEKKESNDRATKALERQVADLRQQLMSIEQGAASYKRQHRLDGSASDDNRAGQISQLADALAVAKGSRAEADVRSGGSNGTAPTLTSPLLTSLREQETQMRRHLAELTTSFGRGHPDVQKTEAQLGEVQQALAAESNRVQRELLRDTSAQRAREAELGRELRSAQARSLDDVITAVPLADMERNGDATRAVYIGLLGRLDARIRENELTRPDAMVAFVALPPTGANSPKVARIFVLGIAASLIFAIILVLVIEQLDSRLRTAAQVHRAAGLFTFGMLPELRRHKRQQLTQAGEIDRPYSAFTEEVRSVSNRIERLLPTNRGGVLLVSSPEPSDGKTTLSLALAAAAIATGRTAVLVDLDLRRPELAQRLGHAPDDVDLIAYLAGGVSLDAALHPCPGMPSLQALTAIRAAEDPGALLAARKIQPMLDALRARFDLIVINTPPVLAVHDAAAIAPLCDFVLLVISWGRTSRHKLAAVAAQFAAPSTAVVFNHVNAAQHQRATYADYISDRRRGPRLRSRRSLGTWALTHRRHDASAD